MVAGRRRMIVNDDVAAGCTGDDGRHGNLVAAGDGVHFADDSIDVYAADEENLVASCGGNLMAHQQQCIVGEVFMSGGFCQEYLTETAPTLPVP